MSIGINHNRIVYIKMEKPILKENTFRICPYSNMEKTIIIFLQLLFALEYLFAHVGIARSFYNRTVEQINFPSAMMKNKKYCSEKK
jgi:hypothetical protein